MCIRSRILSFVSVLLCLLMLVSSLTVSPVLAATEELEATSRLIHVVYDDSNSMIAMINAVPKHVSTAWSEAKYSLMILHAMMQENDVMNVYFMSDFSPAQDGGNENEAAGPLLSNLSGKDSQKNANIQKILNATTYTGGTFFSSIRKAYKDLKKNGDSYDERHLIVLTDGEGFYNNEGSSDLNTLFSSAEDNRIKVTYLAIGQNAIRPNADNDAVKVLGAIPDNVGSADSILNCVEEAARHIFQREPQMLDNGKLTVNYPVSEIVVFAQGKDVSIGNIQGATKASFSAALTQNDKDKATAYPDLTQTQIGGLENVLIAEGLSGEVAVFKPQSGTFFPEATYALDVQATTYTVYCKPCLDVQLTITDMSGNIVKDGDRIASGPYTADYSLTYPEGHQKHGQPVTDLGFDVRYTLTVHTDGKQTSSVEGNGPQPIELHEGESVVTVTARYLTYVSTDASMNFTVDKDAGLKVIITDIQPDPIYSGSFNDPAPTVRVTVTWCGQPLTKEQYDLLSLSAEMEKKIFVADGIELIAITGVTLDPFEEGKPTTGMIAFIANGGHEVQRTEIPGNDAFTVTATLGQADQAITATAKGRLQVERTWTIFEIMGIVLAIGGFLFILFGYVICKKYLPAKIYYSSNHDTSAPPDVCYPYKDILALITVILPFVPVTASICVDFMVATKGFHGWNYSRGSVGMKIRAKSKSSAIFVDAVEQYNRNIYLDVTDAELDFYKEAIENGMRVKPPKCLLNYTSSSLSKDGEEVVTFCGKG